MAPPAPLHAKRISTTRAKSPSSPDFGAIDRRLAEPSARLVVQFSRLLANPANQMGVDMADASARPSIFDQGGHCFHERSSAAVWVG
jgi:hypothetical protein